MSPSARKSRRSQDKPPPSFTPTFLLLLSLASFFVGFLRGIVQGIVVFVFIVSLAAFIVEVRPSKLRDIRPSIVFSSLRSGGIATVMLISFVMSLVLIAWPSLLFSEESLSAAEFLTRCRNAHSMVGNERKTVDQPPSPAVTPGALRERQVYSSCDWPIPAWGAGDGYSEIQVNTLEGPDPYQNLNTEMADLPFPIVDLIKAPCSNLRIGYTTIQQDFSRRKEVTVRSGTLYDANGKQYEPRQLASIVSVLKVKPDREDILVMRDGTLEIDNVDCIS